MPLDERLKSKLSDAKNVLVLATGGGNDAVSVLLLLPQLEKDFGFSPASVTVVAMLPDGVAYQDMRQLHPLYYEILSISSRWINHKRIEAFPEPLLAENAAFMGIERVIGLDMVKGSVGVAKALHHLIVNGGFDTVIALDVGGDFIATPENDAVMSPMMDAYALYALKAAVASNPGVNFMFGVFGLGTDGESTPEMLNKALDSLSELHQGTIEQSQEVNKVIQFYDETISPNRGSRTTEMVIKSIKGFPIDRFSIQYRDRFHTQPMQDDVRTHYVYFDHTLDAEHTGKYYLFDRIWDIENSYAIESNDSIEWFRKINKFTDKLNHELNGQTSCFSSGNKVYFGTPPRRFLGGQRKKIISEIVESIYSGVHPTAFMYVEDLIELNTSGLIVKNEDKLVLVSQTDIVENIET